MPGQKNTTIATNKKAFHDYEILERLEAGIQLTGSEVKAIRMGKINLKDSFVRIVKDEAFAFGIHITHLTTVNPHFKPDEKRSRKLLLHKKEIKNLEFRVKSEGLSIIPLKLYFNGKNIAKLQIGLARGLKKYDKREVEKKKSADMEAKKAMKRF